MSKIFIAPTPVYHGAFKVASSSRDTASGPQYDFISSLLGQKEVPVELRLLVEEALDCRDIDKKTASGLIDALKDCSYRPRETKAPVPTLAPDDDTIEIPPAGRYAITAKSGDTAFYRVDRPTEPSRSGKDWTGYTFVKVQAGSDWHPIGTVRPGDAPKGAVATIFAQINADGPKQASIRYGHEIGSCGVCGRELTKKESIEAGIGPICATRF